MLAFGSIYTKLGDFVKLGLHFGRYVAKAKLFCLKNFVPVTQAGVVHTKIFPSRLTCDLGPVFLYEHIEIFTNGRVARRDLGTRAS